MSKLYLVEGLAEKAQINQKRSQIRTEIEEKVPSDNFETKTKVSDEIKHDLHELHSDEKTKCNKPKEKKLLMDYVMPRNIRRNYLPLLGCSTPALMHLAAGLLEMGDKKSKFLDKSALGLTKLSNALIEFDVGTEAWQDGRSYESIGRLIEPFLIPFMSLENVTLARGLCAGFINIHFGNADEPEVSKDNVWKNLADTTKVSWRKTIDIFKNGFGKNRVFLTSGDKDKGHTSVLAGHMNIIGALITLVLGKGGTNLTAKTGSLIKGIGNIIGMVNLFKLPDKSSKITAGCYTLVNLKEIFQRWLPRKWMDIVNNLNMAVFNLGNLHLARMGQQQTNDDFKGFQSKD